MSPSTTITSSSNSGHPTLTPIVTTPQAKCSTPPRTTTSLASKQRLSEYSTSSAPIISRAHSYSFPEFTSSLPYTTVRDFAYSATHPMHCGPVVDVSRLSSGLSTPVSESAECLSDPILWDSRVCWGSGACGEELINGEQLPPIHSEDGPPWSEDEDLQSPVVVSSRHRKHKSSNSNLGGGKRRSGREAGERVASMLGQSNYEPDRRLFLGSSGDGCKRYFVSQGDESSGPGGEVVRYSEDESRHFDPYNVPGQRDSRFAATLPNISYADDVIHDSSGSEISSTPPSPGSIRREESRYSRDYKFTITSSDEEMHGKAVALFDFVRENENELPLIEGQVIWVSYRHGQGWLVAEDPKTQESGLVPESYVRLLRDIHGELNSTTTGQVNDSLSPFVQDSGIQASKDDGIMASGQFSNGSDYQTPIVSTFSTSSKDLNPFPHHLLGTQAGQAPPQVIHYQGQPGCSQVSTPLTPSPVESTQRDKNDGTSGNDNQTACPTSNLSFLPESKLESLEPNNLSSNFKNDLCELQAKDEISLDNDKSS